MKSKYLFLVFFLFFSQFVHCQVYFPNITSNEDNNVKIVRIEKNQSYTKIDFQYTRKQSTGIYIYLNPPGSEGAYYIKANGTEFSLLKTEGIGDKDGITAANPFKTILFSAYFEPIPNSVDKLDLIEGTSGTWNFYDISLDESNANTSEKVLYQLTLKMDGRLKDKGDTFGNNLYKISSGEKVDVYSYENGYYKVNHNGNIGYLSDLYFKEYSSNNSNNFNSSNSFNNTSSYSSSDKTRYNSTSQNNYSNKVCKSYYKDGKAFQYYVHNGISVTMQLSIDNNYGKYYIAYIAIENLTGHEFNFDPTKIKAVLVDKGEYTDGIVLSADEYMHKVRSKQAWNAALVAFGESYSANQAGYSTSRTTSTTTGYSNTYGSASGYVGNYYGSVYGSSSTYGTATTRSTTNSYNASERYAAQQNAQRNINNYQNQQYQIRSVLNHGYLKLNTIFNEERIVGQVNIKFKKAEKIKIIVPVNGDTYEFWWNNK